MLPDPNPTEFARLAEALRTTKLQTCTPEEIVDYVRHQLYADHAGINLIRGGRLETIAATGDVVQRVDAFQHELDEGPGRDSSWHRQTLLIDDLTNDSRWPRWASAVTALGIASVLAAELRGHGARRLGSFSVYCTQRRTFTDDDIAFVSIFARHAAIALAESLHETGLYMAMDTRKLIGQAQGLLMERHGLDKDQAFEVLRRYSQVHNIKLHYVAEHLLAARQLPSPGEIATKGAEDMLTQADPSERHEPPRLRPFRLTAGAVQPAHQNQFRCKAGIRFAFSDHAGRGTSGPEERRPVPPPRRSGCRVARSGDACGSRTHRHSKITRSGSRPARAIVTRPTGRHAGLGASTRLAVLGDWSRFRSHSTSFNGVQRRACG